MRKPHQILAILYKKDEKGNYLYAVFHRKDHDQWQALSGGVEDDETYEETVRRETKEETGLTNIKITKLESISTIPVVNVTGEFTWSSKVPLVYEHCFGVEVLDGKIKLSNEHNDIKWLNYEKARKQLTWDSNKTALWELNYKLTNNKII